MTTRAERRRQMRTAGYRRADDKKGKRPAIRTPAGGEAEAYMERLVARGFQIVGAHELLRRG